MAKKHANLAFFVPHLGCTHACVYCSQTSISGAMAPPTPREVEETCARHLPPPGQGEGTEIAFFGGSFTAIPPKTMSALLAAAKPFVRQKRAAGIRISTRPDAVGERCLSLLREEGVTAIELGAQSMQDEVLQKNGRGHSSEDVRAASARIRSFGFSLGLQMMLGLYGETDPAVAAAYNAEQLLALSPDTLRVYPTLVLRDTPLAALYESGRYRPLSLEQAVELCAMVLQRANESGVRVIRMGLHREQSLQRALLAGPFHPAFGELCESRLLRSRLEPLAAGRTKLEILCDPRLQSRLLGHKKENVRYFAARGTALCVTPRQGMQGFAPRCGKQNDRPEGERIGVSQIC